MTTLLIIGIVLVGYVLPAYLVYNYIQVAFSKNGIWENISPGSYDLFLTFTPGFNIFVSVAWIFAYPSKLNSINYYKFFKIKK